MSVDGAVTASEDPVRRVPGVPEPTRYALHLRRQAANRHRAGVGLPALPVIRPGSCAQCAGWGVEGKDRLRCEVCGGSGMRP